MKRVISKIKQVCNRTNSNLLNFVYYISWIHAIILISSCLDLEPNIKSTDPFKDIVYDEVQADQQKDFTISDSHIANHDLTLDLNREFDLESIQNVDTGSDNEDDHFIIEDIADTVGFHDINHDIEIGRDLIVTDSRICSDDICDGVNGDIEVIDMEIVDIIISDIVSPDTNIGDMIIFEMNVGDENIVDTIQIDMGVNTDVLAEDSFIGVTEVCNGEDDDGDGEIDEDFDFNTDIINCGFCNHVCDFENTTAGCVDGRCYIAFCDNGFVDIDDNHINGCEYACTPTLDPTEICDSMDNDCDGEIDEGFDLNNSPNHCGECNNVCELINAISMCLTGECTIMLCSENAYDLDEEPSNGCEYICERTNDSIEICDTVDNNCNGATDEGFDLETNPEHCGECDYSCVFQNASASCTHSECQLEECEENFFDADAKAENGCECTLSNNGIELCDGVDNNCNGQIDETFIDQLGQECFLGTGECRSQGHYICGGNGQVACNTMELLPQDEICDGLDNNCNNEIDDGNPGGDEECNTGELGVCSEGITVCDLERETLLCQAINSSSEEICDGLDNDCDGDIDEFQAPGDLCREFVEISSGTAHSCALRRDGSILCWGRNKENQCKAPEILFDQISSGGIHTCGVHDNGSISCWGENEYGQTTVPDIHDFIYVSAGFNHTCALTRNGSIECWGKNDDNGQATPPNGHFIALNSGGYHTCAIRNDQSISCWGKNNHDQETPPDSEDFIQLALGNEHTCGLHENGTVECWGKNNLGQTIPPEIQEFVSIRGYSEHTCGIREDGSAECWGNNAYGEAVIPDGHSFLQLDTGHMFTCGIKENRSIFCWGSSQSAKLIAPEIERFVTVATGTEHACLLRTDGSVACWGTNYFGESVPPDGMRFTEITAGGRFTCGLRQDGTALCWGEEYSQPVPDDHFLELSSQADHICGLRYDGQIKCWGRYYDGTVLLEGHDFIQVSAGGVHTCALHEGGVVTCWNLHDGYLNTPVPEETFTHITTGFYHTCGITEDSSILCWGGNDFGESDSPNGFGFIEVSAGHNFTCALHESGILSCWGWNSPDYQGILDNIELWPQNAHFSRINSGYYNVCAINDSDSVNIMCWGRAQHGTFISTLEAGSSSEELCDGIDNDYDGEFDEDFFFRKPCTVEIDECERPGMMICDGLEASICDPFPLEDLIEVCDEVDNNCNNEIDECVEGSCFDGECCIPDCRDAECGDDGCGGECGICEDEAICRLEQCIICEVDISNYICTHEVQVINEGLPSDEASIVWNGNGYGIVWEDFRNDKFEIFFARLDANGVKIGDDVRIPINTASSVNPSIVWNGSGYGVSWQSDLGDNGNWDIYFAFLNINGAKVGDKIKITNNIQSQNPSLVWNGNNYGVSWIYDNGIYFTLISANGTRISENIHVTSDEAQAHSPSLVWNDNGYGVSWWDSRDDTYEIYFARMDVAGIAIGGEQKITNGNVAVKPSLVWNDDGYGLSWYDEPGQDIRSEIYFVRLDMNGVKIGEESRITHDNSFSYSPSLVWNGNGYGVGWWDDRDGHNQIYFTTLDTNGEKTNSERRITRTDRNASQPFLTWNGESYGISWNDGRNQNGIYFAEITVMPNEE